jgi:quinol-cytochrome oxidoreductase complex cytochrome b subunit
LFAAAWALLALQIATGVAIATWYPLNAKNAHAALTEGGVRGATQGFHYWASALTILLVVSALFLMLWQGWHSWKTRGVWWVGLATVAAVMGAQLSGNILPASKHDIRTANIEAGIAASVPIFGESLKEQVLGGQQATPGTVERWYALHRFVATPVLLGLAVIGILVLRPFRLRARPLAILAACVLPLILGAALGAPLGPPADTSDFASTGANAMWYVAPQHTLLVASQRLQANFGWIGAIAIPGVVFLGLAILPVFRKKTDSPSNALRATALIGLVAIACLAFALRVNIQSPFSEPTFAEEAANAKAAVNKELAVRGRTEFVRLQCMHCHKVGREGSATIGPNLGAVGKRLTDAEWLVSMLQNPASKGRGTMPSFAHQTPETLRAVAEYLRSLR